MEGNIRQDVTPNVAAMALEDIAVNSKQLGDLVTPQVNAGTTKLQAKIAPLEQVAPKKPNRRFSAIQRRQSEKKKDQEVPMLKRGANAPKAATMPSKIPLLSSKKTRKERGKGTQTESCEPDPRYPLKNQSLRWYYY